MLDGGSKAESLMNLTAKVWNNTIHEERDIVTDKFTTRQDGNFYTDFNLSLKVLFLDTNTINTVKIIEKSQASVERLMKDLQNPPEKYKQVYSLLLELYSSYQSITGLAINPQGSLQSFTDSKMEKIDKFLELYNKVNTILPEKSSS
ncbi:MAG: hypothetical protein MUO64_03285 [Anaerolineales bacterium]|nr:hypothetical protein [Anaerolineales bacterium]